MRRVVAVPVGIGLTLMASWMLAAPAVAAVPDDGDEPGAGLTALEAILLYVIAPVALFALIALLVLAPSIARGPRYRPGLGWFAAPVWFGGPANPDTALARVGSTPTAGEGGGASARW